MTNLPNINRFGEGDGTIVTFTVPQEEVNTIARYRYDRAIKDIKTFIQETISDTVRWMDRMTNGLEQFELDTLEHWTYNSRTERLSMKDTKRDYDAVFDMSFTSGTIEQYNQGLATILNGFWYKTHAVPTAVVELIAAADLLYSQHHGHSPASASGLKHVDVGQRK